MEKPEVALLKSFIEMFSPLLEASLYTEDETVTKIKKTPLRRVPSEEDYAITGNSSDFNSTDPNDTEEEPALFYSEDTNYSFSEDGNNTFLESQA